MSGIGSPGSSEETFLFAAETFSLAGARKRFFLPWKRFPLLRPGNVSFCNGNVFPGWSQETFFFVAEPASLAGARERFVLEGKHFLWGGPGNVLLVAETFALVGARKRFVA